MSPTRRAVTTARQFCKRVEETVDILQGAHHQEPYASLNPNRMVPMLEDGDLRLTESSAILKYLADKYDLPSYPKDIKKRARVNEVMDWLNTQLYRDFGYGLVYPQLFPHHKRRSDEAHAGCIAWGQQGAKRWLQTLNDHWIGPKNQYLCGDEITIADYFGACLVTIGGMDRLRPRRLSQRRALARQHEEAQIVGPGQRSFQWLRRRQQGQGIRKGVVPPANGASGLPAPPTACVPVGAKMRAPE
jgi:glutathione S-transferase